MTKCPFQSASRSAHVASGVGLLGLSACGSVQPPPPPRAIAGLTPAGTVTLTEVVAAGMTGEPAR